MDPEDSDLANQDPYISSRPPFLPPTTPQQAIQALLSPDSLSYALIHQVQPWHEPGLAESLLHGNAVPARTDGGLAGVLASHGITSLPGSDPRLVNVTTDTCKPAFETAKGTVIQMNKPGPQTLLPSGTGLERLIALADGTGAAKVTVNGGSEAQGHSSNTLDAHGRNLGVDIAPNPDVSEATLKKAALAAGYTHGIREIKSGGVHYHFQVGPENIKDDPDLFDLTNDGAIGTKDYTKAQSPSKTQGAQG